MLLSHHPPCDYDHTISVGRMRICTRCSGILIGITFFLIWIHIHLFSPMKFIFFSVLLPLPAVFDFTTHELGWQKSSNLIRLITGVSLGISIGFGIIMLIQGILSYVILQFLLLVGLEFVAIFILKSNGHLEDFIKRYEESIWE